jgi:hypothetical protein
MMRKLVWATGVGALIAGVTVVAVLGTAGAKPAVPSPTATGTTGTTAPKTVVLTNSSDGSMVIAEKGDLVVVRLTGVPLRWSEATAAPGTRTAAPVLVKKSGSTSANGSSVTTFRVANYGVEGINAVGTPICSTAMACPAYAVLWHATVSVPVVDPAGAT